jgi:hypothetical protein
MSIRSFGDLADRQGLSRQAVVRVRWALSPNPNVRIETLPNRVPKVTSALPRSSPKSSRSAYGEPRTLRLTHSNSEKGRNPHCERRAEDPLTRDKQTPRSLRACGGGA